MPSIYKLKLHESIRVGWFTILRVPGGWLYSTEEADTFVPFDNEFMEIEND